MYYSFALAGHRGTCLRPLHIFALLCFLVALIHVKFDTGNRHVYPLRPCKTYPKSVRGGGYAAPKIYIKFPLFGKESSRRGESPDRFLKSVRGFYAPNYPAQVFQFGMIRLTGYGVTAEKPRVGYLLLIFPCTL